MRDMLMCLLTEDVINGVAILHVACGSLLFLLAWFNCGQKTFSNGNTVAKSIDCDFFTTLLATVSKPLPNKRAGFFSLKKKQGIHTANIINTV